MEDFDQLAKQYEPMIHKIIHSLHIYKNVEEFYQIGLIALWEAQKRFKEEKGSFTNFAYSLIKGEMQHELTRSRKQEERSAYPEESYWELIMDPHTFQPLEAELILSYCHELTTREIKWVLAFSLAGLSIKEIAEKEQVSPSAVKQWRSSAKKKLRNQLMMNDASITLI